MENYEKQAILSLKNRIKELNAEQKTDKIQRKTVHVPEGFKRTKSAKDAAMDVADRKVDLRMLYKIYEIWREKETTADPNFHNWIISNWGYGSRFENLKSELWDKYTKTSEKEN